MADLGVVREAAPLVPPLPLQGLVAVGVGDHLDGPEDAELLPVRVYVFVCVTLRDDRYSKIGHTLHTPPHATTHHHNNNHSTTTPRRGKPKKTKRAST